MKTDTPRDTVLYSLDGSERYNRYALFSIESLRSHSPRFPVRVCYFGKIARGFRKRLEALDVSIRTLPASPRRFCQGIKWFALASVSESRRVCSIDADTCILRPIEELFRRNCRRDFYALTESDFWQRQLDHSALWHLRHRYGIVSRPVFNSSLILFNNGSHRRVIERLPLFAELFWGIIRGDIPNPVDAGRFLAEECCGTLVLGQRPALSHGTWKNRDVTHFNRWTKSPRGSLGTVLHLGHHDMSAFTKRFGSDGKIRGCKFPTKRELLHFAWECGAIDVKRAERR